MRTFAEITQSYISRPFRECSCIGMLHQIYREMGITLPTTYDGMTIENYMDHYRDDPRGTQIKLLALIRSLGEQSSATLPHMFDLLVIAQNTNRKNVVKPGFFPAIYVGQGNAMASFLGSGVLKFQLDHNQRAIVARRVV